MAKTVKFEFGKQMRALRKAKGLTLEQLATGDPFDKKRGAICDQSELAKYERGERQPGWDKFEKLMQRLGESAGKYYREYTMTPQDREYSKKKQTLMHLTRKGDAESIKDAKGLISELEQDAKFIKDRLNKQFILCINAIIAHHQKDYQTMYNLALEGIKITKPSFDEENIDKYTLFFVEISLINQIAIAHKFISSLEKSTSILLRLKSCLDRGHAGEEEYGKTYMQIQFNLSNNLGQLQRYDECLPICEAGAKYCDKRDDSFFLPLFMYNQGCCLLALNKKEEAIAILKDAMAIFKSFKRFDELSAATSYVRKTFGVEIEEN